MTKQTLSALSAMVNAGGLGQLGDIAQLQRRAIRTSGHCSRSARSPRYLRRHIREQRDNFVSLINELNRVAATFAGQRDIIKRALRTIPPALDVLEQRGAAGDGRAGQTRVRCRHHRHTARPPTAKPTW